MNRCKAAALHVAMSAFAVSLTVGLIIYVCYPSALVGPLGGWKLLGLVAAVDVVLGPLLTLIVFKPGKPGLKLDLSLIAAFQLAALSFGSYAAWNSRPIYVVVTATQVDLRFANDFPVDALDELADSSLTPPLLGQPHWVALRDAASGDESLVRILLDTQGTPPTLQPRFFVSLEGAMGRTLTGCKNSVEATCTVPLHSTRGSATVTLVRRGNTWAWAD